MLFPTVLALAAAGKLAAASPLPQEVPNGPNTIAQYNPTLRTGSANETWIVVPIDKSVAAGLVAPKKLVPIANDTSRYPHGFPAGKHPLLVSVGWMTHIEQLGLEIPQGLMSGGIFVPCVDQLGDGHTCFQSVVSIFVGGDNNNRDNAQPSPGTVPATVATLEGTTTRAGDFTPGIRPFDDIGGGQYTAQVDYLIAPNPVSGPSLAPNVFSVTFKKQAADASLLTAHGFHDFISQPQILNNGLCNRNAYYFNESFARPFFTQGSVTLYPYLAGTNGVPDAIAGTYNGASGYSANAVTVGNNPQTCDQAAAQTDPKSVEK